MHSGGSGYKLQADPDWASNGKNRTYEPAKFGYTYPHMGFEDGGQGPAFDNATGTEESRKLDALDSLRATPGDAAAGPQATGQGRTAHNTGFISGNLPASKLSDARKPHSLLGAYIIKRKDSSSRRQSASEQDQLELEAATEPQDFSDPRDAKSFHLTGKTQDTNLRNSALSSGLPDKNRSPLDPAVSEEKDFSNLNHLGKMPKNKNLPPTHINAGIASVVGSITIADSQQDPFLGKNGPVLPLQSHKPDPQSKLSPGDQPATDKPAAKREATDPSTADGPGKPDHNPLQQSAGGLQRSTADGLADSAALLSSLRPSLAPDAAEEKTSASAPLDPKAPNSTQHSKAPNPAQNSAGSKEQAKDLFGRTKSLAGSSKDKQALAASSRKPANRDSKNDFISDKLATELGRNPFSEGLNKKPNASSDRLTGGLNFGAASKILKEPTSASKQAASAFKPHTRDYTNPDRKQPSIKMATPFNTSTAPSSTLEQKLQCITRSDAKSRNPDPHPLGNPKPSLAGAGNKTFVDKKTTAKQADGSGSTFVRARGTSLENARLHTAAGSIKELASSKLVDRRLQSQEERGRSLGQTARGLRDSQDLKLSPNQLQVGLAHPGQPQQDLLEDRARPGLFPQ